MCAMCADPPRRHSACLGIISNALVTRPAETSTPVLIVMTLSPRVSCTGTPHWAPYTPTNSTWCTRQILQDERVRLCNLQCQAVRAMHVSGQGVSTSLPSTMREMTMLLSALKRRWQPMMYTPAGSVTA